MDRKKVLLLCASHNDLGLIFALKKLEYYVIATGNIENLIGQQYVDEYIKADYSDKELILSIAVEKKVDAICQCCNDFGVYTAAYVAEKLGLLGYDSYETTELLHNKDKFKAFAKEMELLSPISEGFEDMDMAKRYIENVSYPIIVKPVDASAGNGINKASDKNEAIKAIEFAFEKSRRKRIIIEPYITGSQHGFCTFLINKKVVAYSSNNEYSIINPFRVEIDTFPADTDDSVAKLLIEQIEKIAEKLDLVDGIFHLQYILQDSTPYIIEVMRRVLGNMYSVPANKLNNIEWDYWEARAKCGLSCDDFPKNVESNGFYAYKALLAPRNGIINKIKIPEYYKEFMYDKCILMKAGETITNYKSQPVGLIFLRFGSQEEMQKVLIENYSNDCVEVF